MEILLSPYFTALLCSMVVIKWSVAILRDFDFRLIGGLFTRTCFLAIYLYILFYNPPAEDIRLFVRGSIQLLFIDEIINWTACKFDNWRKPRLWTKGKQ